jgi:hypothetical protein
VQSFSATPLFSDGRTVEHRALLWSPTGNLTVPILASEQDGVGLRGPFCRSTTNFSSIQSVPITN